jgi:predicted acyl esterase
VTVSSRLFAAMLKIGPPLTREVTVERDRRSVRRPERPLGEPRYARNTGSEESLATAATLYPAQQTIHHDPAHPSAVLLPVVPHA